VTVTAPVAESRPAGGWAPEPLARCRPTVATAALSAATGVLVVATAYTAGRLGYASARWARGVYWLGQALIVVPAAARLLSRRPGAPGQAAIVVIFTVAEYLVKVCYSPAYFTTAAGVVEAVRVRPVIRVISIDTFGMVCLCPVQCIGIAARVAAWDRLRSRLWRGVIPSVGHPPGYPGFSGTARVCPRAERSEPLTFRGFRGRALPAPSEGMTPPESPSPRKGRGAGQRPAKNRRHPTLEPAPASFRVVG
jgi:hypothetical protein